MTFPRGTDYRQKLSPQPLGSGSQPTALVIVQPQAAIPELFAKDPILLAQVVDHLELVLVPPSGDRDQHEPEGIDNWGPLVDCRESPVCAQELARRQADPVFRLYGNKIMSRFTLHLREGRFPFSTQDWS